MHYLIIIIAFIIVYEFKILKSAPIVMIIRLMFQITTSITVTMMMQ